MKGPQRALVAAAISWALDSPARASAQPSLPVTVEADVDHASAITGVALSPDGERAFSVSLDTTLKVWNLKDGVLVKTLSLHGRPLEGIAMLADGRRVVVVDELGYAGLIDTESGVLVREYPRGAWGSWDGVLQGQSGVTISGDEQRVATYGFSGRMVVYDLASGNEIDFGPAARHALFMADSEHLWIAEFGGGLGRKTIGVEDTDDLEATVGAGGLPVASARGNAIVGMAAGRLSFYRAGARVALESNWDNGHDRGHRLRRQSGRRRQFRRGASSLGRPHRRGTKPDPGRPA